MGLTYHGQASFHQVIFLSFVGGTTPRGMGGLWDGALPGLQVSFLPHIFGGLGGWTAPLQVLPAPQEETLAIM